MIRSRHIITLAALALTCASITAANASIGDDFVSPVTTKPASTVLISGAALTTALVLLEDSISDPAQAETIEDKPLGKFSKIGDLSGQMIPNGAYALGMWAFGKPENASQMLRASLHSVAVTTVLKHTIREPRPNNGNQRVSFPSGHSTSIFAFASIVGLNHEWYWGASAYALAALVAYSRMNDNQHYLHDVVGGATIGMSYGFGIFTQSKKDASIIESKPGATESPGVWLTPWTNLENFGLAASAKF